jgi:UDP-N-acetylglucosamine--N-acetylmuramyl-(pentapeptide) pyrophosphoryl-undecaprenol N-acetylglucosamine transferase
VTLAFAAGGTGGHLYPAIAIADAVRARDARDDVVFIGTADRLEATIVPKAGYRLETVASRPFARAPLALLRSAAVNLAGIARSVVLLRRLRPVMVIATGGYVCFPVVAAARVLRSTGLVQTRLALLEPNAYPGLTNRLLAPLVDEVWGAFPEPDPRFAGKYVQTGIPVRASLTALPPRAAALARLGLRADRRTLLAMGGSQGARSINDALIGLIAGNGLPEGWQLLHVTGEGEYARVREQLGRASAVVRPYLDDVADAYAVADLVLARAGASTLGELAALGLPSILVPYPYAADDHQSKNAARMAAAGAAVVVADRDLSPASLQSTLAGATAPDRLAELTRSAGQLRSGDPIATILARIDALLARKTPS